MKKVLKIYLVLLISFVCINIVDAEEITSSSTINLNRNIINGSVLDNKESTRLSVSAGSVISISNEAKIQGIYISYYMYSDFTAELTGNEKTVTVGEDGFLHQYINVSELIGETTSVELKYTNNVTIGDLYVIGEGEIPSFVELWNKPCEKADLLLFTTHSDDEQLFFLGLMPTYIARDAYFQVVYFAHHNDNPMRLHEQLHGLYTVGIRNYPIMGYIPDAWSTNLEGAINNIKRAGITEEMAEQFQVQMIRRFKPQVVIGHDEAGEYSHGQHILNTYLLEKAIMDANNSEYDKTSFDKYGNWQISKLYLHLYGKNQITMNYDIPLDYFGGKTAYQVSKEGYKKHNSQQWTWFTGWINGKNNEYTKATDIPKHTPCVFGLYYTNVGADKNKDDMMENITYYKVQEENKRKEEEEKKRLEELEKQKEEEKLQQKEEKEDNTSNNKLVIIALSCVFGLIIILVICLKLSNKKRH